MGNGSGILRRVSMAALAISLAALTGSAWAQSAPATTSTAPADRSAQPIDLAKDKVLYAVGTAHLDTQWLWTIQDTITKCIPDTLRGNFQLIEKFPHYTFSFEGAFRYMLMKEYYPQEYARLKEYIAQGRWRLAGSAVDSGDVNLVSPESLMRQFLYGNGYFQKEFGKTSVDIFLPDCFGFGYALPSVAAHCGLKGFSTCKLQWGSAEPIPFDIGVWEGPDGASIVAALNPGAYMGSINGDLSADKSWSEQAERMRRRSGAGAAFKYYGVGDRGGAPKEAWVDNLEKSIVAGTGPVRVLSTGSDQMFRDLSPANIAQMSAMSHFKGELLMKQHGVGCYTSQAAMKRWNRQNEALADAAERVSVAANWLGGARYPKSKLTEAWVRFLWHQFHDDLTGTSLPEVYAFSWNDEILSLNQFAEVVTDGVGAVSRSLDTRAQGVAVVVYNPLSIARQDVVEASVRFPAGDPKAVRVFDPAGKEVPAQLGQSDGQGVQVIFLAEAPAVGFAVYDVRPSDVPAGMGELKVTSSTLENTRYAVAINEAGDVASIKDKAVGQELLSAPAQLVFLNDKPDDYPAWEIRYADITSQPASVVAGPVQASIVEAGPARVTLEVKRQAQGSEFVQRIRLMPSGAADRVEFDTQINWMTTERMLKATFPLSATNKLATYDLGLGTIDRPTNTDKKYEVPAQQWADISSADGQYGVSILNDCKYGWDKPADNTLRLTLLRNPNIFTKHDSFRYAQGQDIGRHRMLYAIYGHTGDWRNGSAWQGARVNQPLLAFQSPAHEGTLGKSFGLLKVSTPQVAVRAIKQAQASDEVVIRLQETAGTAAEKVRVSLAGPIAEAREINGAESPLGQATVDKGELVVDIKPYQPRTFALKLAASPVKLSPPLCQSVELPLDRKITSADGEQADAGFDGQGRSIPAELLPATITTEGITFKIGGTDGQNALACNGQKVTLKAGSANRLYVLAAATSKDVKGTFSIDGKDVELSVPPFTGKVGQWDLASMPRKGQEAEGIKVQPGFIQRDPVAWLATHTHNANGENDPYIFGYLYKLRIDLPRDAASLTLPKNENIRILAISVVQNENDAVRPASRLYD